MSARMIRNMKGESVSEALHIRFDMPFHILLKC